MRLTFLTFFICLLSLNLYGQEAIEQKEKELVIKKVSKHLEKHYILQDKGLEMSNLIEMNFSKGNYDSVENHLILSKKVNRDMKSIFPDKHLALVYKPWAQLMIDSVKKANSEIKRTPLSAEVLEGNIGLITIGSFNFKPEEWDDAMTRLNNCRAFIIDLRGNSGGYAYLIEHSLSYFFEEKMHFSTSISRTGKESKIYTKKKIEGQRRLKEPVFILIDQHTFSAAESFAYNLQSFDRGIVIGENSAGGAHPKRNYRINKNYFLSISIMRIVNARTKTDWEGSGVNPDILTSSEEAFDLAYQKSLKP